MSTAADNRFYRQTIATRLRETAAVEMESRAMLLREAADEIERLQGIVNDLWPGIPFGEFEGGSK